MSGIEVLSRTQRVIVLPNTSVSIVKEGPTGPKGPEGVQGLVGPQGKAGLPGKDLDGSAIYLKFLQAAMNPDLLIVGTITRDSNGAAVSAEVVWPNGVTGVYTATTVSVDFPGAVDAYTITYGNPATKTYTQSAVTRNTDGVVTNRPAMAVT